MGLRFLIMTKSKSYLSLVSFLAIFVSIEGCTTPAKCPNKDHAEWLKAKSIKVLDKDPSQIQVTPTYQSCFTDPVTVKFFGLKFIDGEFKNAAVALLETWKGDYSKFGCGPAKNGILKPTGLCKFSVKTPSNGNSDDRCTPQWGLEIDVTRTFIHYGLAKYDKTECLKDANDLAHQKCNGVLEPLEKVAKGETGLKPCGIWAKK